MQKLGPKYDPRALAKVYSQTYMEATRHERLFDGIAELLANDFRAAVATGKSQRGADRVIKHFGFEGRFEVILGGNSVPNPKPNPDLLFSIMESTGTKDLIMVGDTTYDLEMANAAGVRAVGVSWGHHPSELLSEWAPVVNSVEELKQHLRV